MESRVTTIVYVLVGVVTLAHGLPLPRLIYQPSPEQSAPMPQYWELRPAPTKQFTANGQSIFTSYMQQGRFDPDRPYIQMIVPVKIEGNALEDRWEIATGPFIEPTRPTAAPTSKTPIPCINATLNVTLNLTTWNETNCTSTPTTKPTTKPVKALFMLNDGSTVYSVGNDRTPDLNGAYELAYVVHRPAPRLSPPASPYTYVQYVDYNQMKMDSLRRMSLSPAVESSEPVYIYKPVYPSHSQSYDAYYYLPVNQEEYSDTAVQSKPELSKKGEDEDSAVQDSIMKEETAKLEDLDDDTVPGTVKEEASEIAMANGVDSTELQQQSLINSLSSEIQAELEETVTKQESDNSAQKQEPETVSENTIVAKAEEELGKLMEDNNKDEYWENELKSISNKDLLSAVEIVLQQLNNRFSE